jgi:RNase P/RNase MRP subunit p29
MIQQKTCYPFWKLSLALAAALLCTVSFLAATVQAQQDPSGAPSANSPQTQGNDHVVEGTVVSTTEHTVVVRTDDNQHHLFTYDETHPVPREAVRPGARVRVSGGAPNESGTRVAESITVIPSVEGTVVSTTEHTVVVRSDDNQFHLFTYDDSHPVAKEAVRPGARVRVTSTAPNGGTRVAESVTVISSGTGAAGTSAASTRAAGTGTSSSGVAGQAAPLPKAKHVTNEIESEARRWHVGGKIGAGLSPELFMFGPQAQFGPFFSDHFLFRPNVEFGFGEVTAMYAVNAEGAYRFREKIHGQWAPYFGAGPSFNFINQSAGSGNISFSNFDYKTGFNIFVGGERNKMFVEMKTSLWSGKAPVFRLFVGYNF